MNPSNIHPDQAIDRILSALRDTPTPRGLEQRIAARIATAQAHPRRAQRAARSWQLSAGRLAPTRHDTETATSRLAALLGAIKTTGRLYSQPLQYAAAATLVVILAGSALISIRHRDQQDTHHTSPLAWSPLSNTSTQPPTIAQRSAVSLHTSRLQLASSIPPPPDAFTDPDAIALAETLAPSHPAPLMPLTAQERLLVLSTRQGQPIELAELDILRQPALEAAAEARERATLRNYIHSLLGPLAAVEAINPTPPSPSSSDPQSDPPSSK